jgi:hypothetical protein
MKIEARPVYLGNGFTVWIGNYRLLFQGTREEAEHIAAEYRRKMNRSGTKKRLTKAAGVC